MASINWDDIAAGGAGAVDELLFGAPEWLLKKFGDRKAVEDYIKAHEKAYRIGETVGTVGGAFIPVGGALKAGKLALGLGKAAKAAKVGSELARLGEVAAPAARSALGEIARLAGRGAAAGGAEAAARGLFDEESAGQIAQDISQGTLFGGLGGAAAGALSKAAPKLTSLLKKGTEKATIGLTDANTRGLLQSVQKLSGEGSGAMKQAQTVDDIRREISDLIKSKKLYKEGAVASAAEAQSKVWKQLDDVYEKVAGGKTGMQVLTGGLGPEDMANLANKYDPETLDAAITAIAGPLGKRTGLANIRGKLEDLAKNARVKGTGNAEIDDATFDIAKTLRRNLDDSVIKAAEDAGVKIPENFKREYGLLMPIAKGEVRADIAPSKFNLGSPTFEKAAAATVLGGGSSLLGGPDEDIQTKLARGAAGAALGFGASKALGALTRKGVASADTLAGILEKAAPKIAEAAPDVAVMGGRLAENVQREATKAAAPTTEEEAQAASDGAEAGQAVGTPQYTGLIMGKLAEFAAANGIEPDSQDYKDFVQAVGSATMSAEGQPFDPRMMAKLLYPDDVQRAKYLKALDVSQRLSASLSPAVKSRGGLFGIGEDVEERINRETALDKLGSLVGEVAKATGTEKAAKKQLQTILGMRASQADKKKLIMSMLESYGVDFETLQQAGLGNV